MGGLFGDAQAADLTDAQKRELMRAVGSLMGKRHGDPPNIVPVAPETILSVARHRKTERRNPESVYFPGHNQVFWPYDKDQEEHRALMAHEFAHAIQDQNGLPMDEREADWVQRKIRSFPKGRKE